MKLGGGRCSGASPAGLNLEKGIWEPSGAGKGAGWEKFPVEGRGDWPGLFSKKEWQWPLLWPEGGEGPNRRPASSCQRKKSPRRPGVGGQPQRTGLGLGDLLAF